MDARDPRESIADQGLQIDSQGASWRMARWHIALVLIYFLALFLPRAHGDDGVAAERPLARRVRVPLPLTGSADTLVKRTIQQILDQRTATATATRPILILEFWPTNGSDGSGSEFERSLALARYLVSPELRGVRTIGFIPRAALGHAVLVAMACEELIMAPDAVMGDAGAGETNIGPLLRGGYTEIASGRRTLPEGLALRMLDRDLMVYRITTSQGVLYAREDELESLAEHRHDLLSRDTVAPAATAARFRGDQLRQWEHVSHLASDIGQVASLLNLDASALELDPSLGGAWQAIRIELTGPMTTHIAGHVRRTIEQQRAARRANLMILEIDSVGGDPIESVKLAHLLAGLDPAQVRTVAYVAHEARGDAALIAFACDHLLMHPDAVIGGEGAATVTEELSRDLREPIRSLATAKGRDWSLPAAMLDRQLMVRPLRDGAVGPIHYWCDEELAEKLQLAPPIAGAEPLPVPAGWQAEPAITQPGQVLELTATQATKVGMTRAIVEGDHDLLHIYGLEATPELMRPNWAFDVIEALASPQLAVVLLVFGGIALLSELSSPGLGFGAVVSILCFMLYFWSQFLHGTANVLEILLFLTGLMFLAVELFVLPGFGIFGIGGIGLILASLVLASQTFVWPTNSYQSHSMLQWLVAIFISFAGIGVGMVIMSKYWHRVPLLGRMALQPLDEEERVAREQRETLVDYRHLLHQHGVAQTTLRPSGKARIGEQLVDVQSDGAVIDKGERIRVVDVLGNRIIVRAMM